MKIPSKSVLTDMINIWCEEWIPQVVRNDKAGEVADYIIKHTAPDAFQVDRGFYGMIQEAAFELDLLPF